MICDSCKKDITITNYLQVIIKGKNEFLEKDKNLCYNCSIRLSDFINNNCKNKIGFATFNDALNNFKVLSYFDKEGKYKVIKKDSIELCKDLNLVNAYLSDNTKSLGIFYKTINNRWLFFFPSENQLKQFNDIFIAYGEIDEYNKKNRNR